MSNINFVLRLEGGGRQRADDGHASVFVQLLVGKFLDARIIERGTITATGTDDGQALSANRRTV